MIVSVRTFDLKEDKYFEGFVHDSNLTDVTQS